MPADPSRDKNAKRQRKINEQTEKNILALQEKYYPRVLAAIILACELRQRSGDFKRCCRKRLCAPCAARESHKRAIEQMDAFLRFSPPAVKPRADAKRWATRQIRIQHAVFTLPPSLRERVEQPGGLHAFRCAVLETIRALHGEGASGVMNLHPMGDDPTKFHPHLDVIINAWALDEGKPVAKKPRFRYDPARETYVRKLEDAFELAPGSIPVADLWFDSKNGYTKSNPRKVWHIIRYSAREVYQPAWAKLDARRADGEDWLYKASKKQDLPRRYDGARVIRNLLRIEDSLHGQQRRVWFGFMKDKQRKKAEEAFNAFTTSKEAEA